MDIPICNICKSKITEFLFGKEGNDFYKCRNCGLVFIWPQPTLKQIGDIYDKFGNEYYLKSEKKEFDLSNSFDERINMFESYRKNNKLLDVGCSTGVFLKAARNKGWEVWGVEISKPAANYAKEMYNLNVYCGQLKKAGYKNDYFDVVNMWSVLEHVSNPAEVISEAHRILRKGGLLILNVPNYESFPIKILGKKYRYICNGHLFYFTKNCIYKLLTQFKIIKIYTEYFSPFTFFEDIKGVRPDTLKTSCDERKALETVKKDKFLFLFLRPIWKSFMFIIKKLDLGEEIRILAEK